MRGSLLRFSDRVLEGKAGPGRARESAWACAPQVLEQVDLSVTPTAALFFWFGLGSCSILFFLLTFIWNSYNTPLDADDGDDDDDDDD